MDKVEILYVTFARDLEWMEYSLESIRKYSSGFTGVKIVVPTCDVDKFLKFEKVSIPGCPVLIKNFLEYPGKGFVHHLAMKCYGDVFCPGANYVLHMDPDSLFTKHFTPDTYFIDNKPVLVIEPFDEIKKYHTPRYYWKQVNEAALGFNINYETMCRHPAVHCRELYGAMRSHIEAKHITPFTDYVIKQQNKFPQGFCEFGALGAFAIEKMPEKYHFIDIKDKRGEGHPEPYVFQGWSYTGVHSPDNARKIKEILG